VSRGGWLAVRLLQIVPTFLLIGVAVFVLARLLPGDVVSNMLGDRASEATIQRLTHDLGLDRSIGVQLLAFLKSAAHGEFGLSLSYRIPVMRLIGERLPVTLMLTGMAAGIAVLLAVPMAFVAALNANRWPDVAIRAVFQVGLSSPVFYVGLVLLTVFAAWLRWFPVGGYGETFGAHLHHLFLPAITLAFSFAAVVMRSLRASVLQVLTAEYVDFARAKGLPARVILSRHVLRNALIATVTLVGLPINNGNTTENSAICRSIVAAAMVRESMSRPNWSVPNGCTHDGGAVSAAKSKASGSCGATSPGASPQTSSNASSASPVSSGAFSRLPQPGLICPPWDPATSARCR
jgi:peptide/nickel transport system permease protein